MTVVLFATMSPTLAGQFNNLVNLAVILIIVPYIYSAVAVVKVVHDHQLPHRTLVTYKFIAITAVIYCLWVIIGGDPRTVVHSLVALLISVPLYPFFIRSMEAAAKRKRPKFKGVQPCNRPDRSAPAASALCGNPSPRRGTGSDTARPAGRRRLDIQLRCQRRHLRFRHLPVHGPETRATVRRPQRQLVRGIDQARAQRVHDRSS
jgi:hypothetical protein